MKLRMQPPPHCDLEGDVAQAARSGQWPAELRAHLDSCPSCADTALVAEFLAQPPETEAAVPDAGLLWWKAEIRRRLEAQEKASAPIRWAEGAVVTAVLACLAYFLLVPLPLDHWPWIAAVFSVFTLGAAGSWLFLTGERKAGARK